ncbi:MAG TPA: hypothetical protein DCY85_05890 [Firmicutes bacterium]|nr:hypothetical protein [Bacillota bacterium]
MPLELGIIKRTVVVNGVDPKVVYVDRYLGSIIYSWLMTSAALWVTGRTTSKPARMRRCLAVGSLGGVYLALIYLTRFQLLPGERLFHNPLLWLIIAAAMVWLTFPGRTLRARAGLLGRLLLIAILPVGITLGLQALLHNLVKTALPQWLLFTLPPACILILGELGWGVVHKSVGQQALVPLNIVFGDVTIQTDALIDTGNLLQDPLTRVPVIIVELAVIEACLPDALCRLIISLNAGHSPALEALEADADWQKRIRVLPYLALGNEHGMLAGLRPDAVVFNWGGQEKSVSRVVVGIYHHRLSHEGLYQALISPDLLETA